MAHSPLAVVTGGAGFIGSHTVDRLIDDGHRVVVLDNFSTGKRANLAQPRGAATGCAIVECDVAHGIFAALAPITATHGPVERIVHLAAQVSVVQLGREPARRHAGQLRRHAARPRVRARAWASRRSCSRRRPRSTATSTTMPVGEDTPTRPMSPYGIDKLASEHALDYYAARPRRADHRAAVLQRLRAAPGSVEPVLRRDLDLQRSREGRAPADDLRRRRADPRLRLRRRRRARDRRARSATATAG